MDGNAQRLFCPVRHAHSLLLPAIIDGLFTKPTTTVALTREQNWSIYRLDMTPALEPKQKYFVFFRVRRSDFPTQVEEIPLDLYVESAYARSDRVEGGVVILQRPPFGKVAERIAQGGKF